MRGNIRAAMAVLCVVAALLFQGCDQGDLRVTLSPQEAVDAGAQWAVDGSAWLNSGDTAIELPSGDHRVTFRPIEGWIAPEAVNAVVARGELTTMEGRYVPDRGETDPPFPTEALFSNRNAEPLTPGPAAAVTMELPQPALVAELLSWHVPGGEKDGGAAAGGAVSLRAVASGKVFGPWPARPQPSKDGEAVAWRATPNIPLDAGAYEVLDSAPESWAWNAASGGAGFVDVTGVWYADMGGLDIGAEGGSGTVGDLEVSVPPGSFPEGVSLNVSSTGEEAAGTEAAGYLLSGLPDSHGPFTVSLPLPDEVPENPMVQVRAEVAVTSAGRVTYGRHTLPAEVRDGRLVFEYPAVEGNEGEKGTKQGGGHRWVVVNKPVGQAMVIENYLLSSGGHFRLDGSVADLTPVRASVESLATALESAYALLIPDTPGEGIGMDFSRRGMPIRVDLQYWWSDDNIAYGVRNGSGDDYIEFNLYKVVDPSLRGEINVSAIHELFHLLQYQYAPTHAMGGPGGWLYEMFSMWSEWLVSSPSHYPDILDGNVYRFPLRGLLNPQDTLALNDKQSPSALYHGYISSLFLRYMIWKGVFGLDGVGRFWNGIAAGKEPYEAFKDAANGDWVDYWIGFCTDMFTGQLRIWNDLHLSVGAVAERVPGVDPLLFWSVGSNSAAGDGHDFSLNLWPLSSQLVQVEVTGNLDDNLKSAFQAWTDTGWPDCSVKVYYYNYRRMREAVYLGQFETTGAGIGGMVLNIPAEAVPTYRILLVVTSREPQRNGAVLKLHCKFGTCPSTRRLQECNAVKLGAAISGVAHQQHSRTYRYVPDNTTETVNENFDTTYPLGTAVGGWWGAEGGSHRLSFTGTSFSYTYTHASTLVSEDGTQTEDIVVRTSGQTDETRCNVLRADQTWTRLYSRTGKDSYNTVSYSEQSTTVESMTIVNIPSGGDADYFIWDYEEPRLIAYDYRHEGEYKSVRDGGNSIESGTYTLWSALGDITDHQVFVGFMKK